MFRIARRVAKDRVISTVDPEARHGHKTAARGFDGYKGHVAIDPDSEIITATTATAGNTGDAEAAMDLLADDLGDPAEEPAEEPAERPGGRQGRSEEGEDAGDGGDRLAAYGDAAYGAGELLAEFDKHGVEVRCRVQPASAPAGMFSKDRFDIDLDAGTVRCPGQHTVPIRWSKTGDGGGTAAFGALCGECPLAARCTSAAKGRSISIGPHQERLAKARKAQADPAWQADYKATRPKVERKIGHLMRRKHGGRRARVRGRTKVAADFALLAASVNLARLGVLGLTHTHSQGWVAAQA